MYDGLLVRRSGPPSGDFFASFGLLSDLAGGDGRSPATRLTAHEVSGLPSFDGLLVRRTTEAVNQGLWVAVGMLTILRRVRAVLRSTLREGAKCYSSARR